MKNCKAFILIDSMLSFSALLIIVLVLFPVYQKLNYTYEQKWQSLETSRQIYTHIVVRKGDYFSDETKICIQNQNTICSKKLFGIHTY
ncbi:hypothetical protein LAU42_06330 [Macrococcus armenti]|uniref:hypothetical protein n=1 Tax=Macrococcus armenti TaxID=2875764 RepID=UPI001CCF4208|nr:hypothetical protein [Macrococcus armenti]UBH21424.1 hypothetical protein LAU42_06330 [Macrococcus armenti]